MNNMQKIEAYLTSRLETEERLVFEAQLLTDPVLRLNVLLQRKVYAILKLYHRKKLKEQAELAHRRLFSDPDKADYQKSITQLFNP